MTKYKLAFVIERYFEFGGLQRDMRRFALVCAQAGHAVTVFTGRWDGPDEPTLKVQIIDFRTSSNHGTMQKLDCFVRNLRKQRDFDCIVGFNRVGGLDVYFGGDLCLKGKLQHQHRMWLRFLPRYRAYLQLEASAFGPTSNTELMLICPSEAESIRRIYSIATNRIHLLPPGIDRNRLIANPLTAEERNEFRKTFGVSEDELMILTVGSSFHTKGIDRGIYAIAALSDNLKKCCRYVVVGQGNNKKFHAIARKAGIGNRVQFTGGRKDVPNFYYAADLLIHPARTETTGSVLLEALVAGLPVIATGNCGYAHYIQKAGGGIVCTEPFDHTRFNYLLGDILTNDKRRAEYGKNGSEYCQNADIYSMVEKGVEIIVNRAKKNREKIGTTKNTNGHEYC